ncbi:MAG: DUF2271 domain-containing protein [Dokdonella sp.]
MRLFALSLLFAVGPVVAADLQITIELPKIDVAEYHRPYVAIWIANEDSTVAKNLAVWYQQKAAKDAQTGKQEPGSRWLADLRQWWRRSGRESSLPIDGVSGATRPAGQYQLSFSDGKPPLDKLAAGNYLLMVEVAREVGGRELKSIPFQWPPTQRLVSDAKGDSEIGSIALSLVP